MFIFSKTRRKVDIQHTFLVLMGLNGAISEGGTLQDAISNITEAIELYLEVQFEYMEEDQRRFP